VLKPIRGWNEIAEMAAEGDMMVLSFLKMARAFVGPDQRIYVRFADNVAKNMVEATGATNGILAALCTSQNRKLAPSDVVFEVMHGDEVLDELDDLII
jgi:hypothetical protein